MLKETMMLLFSLLPHLISAQWIYDNHLLENPNAPTSYFSNSGIIDRLKSENHIKTTDTYLLKGDVKSIVQTVSETNAYESFCHTSNYTFSESRKLLKYEQDTAESFINSNGLIELYTYDDQDQHLVKKVIYDGRNRNHSKTIIHFDSEGFLIQKCFEKYQPEDRNYKNKEGIFDYELNYRYNAEMDTVKLEYDWIIDESPYQREKDRTYRLKEKEPKVEENTQPTPTTFDPKEVFLPHYRNIERDWLGKLVKFYIHDFAIKSSYNIQQLYEFKYNVNNELSEVKYSTQGPQPEYEVLYTLTIEYQERDEKGNWIFRKITKNWQSSQANLEYLQHREITYH